MAMHIIASADDPLLDPFRALKESNAVRDAGGFVAEGRRLFSRLLDADWPIAGVLVGDRDLANAETARLLSRLRAETPIYVLPHHEVRRLIGYKFHRGVMVRARHRPSPSLDAVAETATRILVASALRDPSNLGSVVRTAAAFGWDALAVGPSTPDAFSRRTLRTSMGAVLRTPVVVVEDDAAALRRLRSRFDFAVYAAETGPGAQPFQRLPISDRMALVLGNEDEGVPSRLLAECTAVAAVPTTARVESLNVAAAAAILLQRFGRVPEGGPVKSSEP